ncbi:MAG: type II secretion system protein [Alphaproteobacteria bacterium]
MNPVSSPPSHLQSALAGRVHLSHRERSKSSFMISGEGSRTAKERSPHPNFGRRNSTSPEGRGNAAGFSLIEPKRSGVPAQAGIHLRQAFSLVELSIVLVILGLLVGGILAGQSLIRSSEIRSVISDKEKNEAAIKAFRTKYDSLPGDMSDATAFWGSAGGTGSDATCFMAQTATSPGTCNGNGDGKTWVSVSDWDERFASWKHLANAGLVEGNYSGKTGGAPGSYVQQVGTNLPRATVKNGFFDFVFSPQSAATTHGFAESRLDRHLVTLYGDNASYSALKPEEAWNIDTKMDDGSPVYGNVMSNKKTSAVAPDCTTSDTASSAYAVTDNRILCLLQFALSF